MTIKNESIEGGDFCPYCEMYFKYPGFYQHTPKCAKDHDFIINHNIKQLNENLEKIDPPSVINLVKILIKKSEDKIRNRMRIIEDKIAYIENKEIFEEKLKIEKTSFSNNKITHGVYFIKCNNYVKIGYSQKLSTRLTTLQSANPYPLEVLLCIKGSMQLESYLHRKFRKYRIKGEWFILSPEMIQFIEERKMNEEKISLQT